jgi:hemerythrin-like domain-containing protein
MMPTEVLSNEHRLILTVLDRIEEAAERLDDGKAISPEFFLDAAEFIAGFADKCHHGKEEDILFVALTTKHMPRDSGPVAVMLQEHDEGRRYTAGIRSAAEQTKAGDASAADEIVHNALNYVQLLRQHIFKEDNVLFPMAEQLIMGDELQDVSRKFEQAIAADEASGTTTYYQELAEKLSEYLRVAT